MSGPASLLVEVWSEAVASLRGDVLVRRALEDPALLARLQPGQGGRLVVIALGKAAAAMARGAGEALGKVEGVAVGTLGDGIPDGIRFLPGDHPLPSERSRAGGEALLLAAGGLRPEDVALVLLSGGGSALAELPVPGVTLQEVAEATRILLDAGMPIATVNAVRGQLSLLKAGGLAGALRAERVVALAISDVEGDDPQVIASGPLSPPPAGARTARAAVEAAGLLSSLPASVQAQLGKEPAAVRALPVRVLAGPADLARAAAAAGRRRELDVVEWPGFVGGAVAEEAERFATCGKGLLRDRAGRTTLLVASGEPTLHLPQSHGLGGRCQHLALLVARQIAGTPLCFLAAASDGADGSPAHAGAVVDGGTAGRARLSEVDLAAALERAASQDACAKLGIAIPGTRTGTNLADLQLLLARG